MATKQMMIDNSDPSVTYIGMSNVGALQDSDNWSLKRIQTVDGIVMISWADGQTYENYNWTKRSTYNYEVK